MSDYINCMLKVADNTNLLVPQITDISAKADILNVKSWAFENRMEINWDKTTVCFSKALSQPFIISRSSV